MTSDLTQLLQQTGLWRASHLDADHSGGIPTGYPQLDQLLPGHGWPVAGITELLHDHAGIGELRLLLPALARLSHRQARWILLVAPPCLPYAPALAMAGIDLRHLLVVRPPSPGDVLWTMEQALVSGSCSAMLGWPGLIREKQIRRLQVASKEGHCLGFLFRGTAVARQASPAELRIVLGHQPPNPLYEHSAVSVQVIKRRGGWGCQPFTLNLQDRLNQITPDFSDMAVTNPEPEKPALGFIDYAHSTVTHERRLQ
ncbi:MAG: translesion DNA synthesis-associated protein ImuA [Pseudomonadales bacterium]|nr:translesion DNA synthesis-associated protein ImuA [Pseudomonadales bacterium]